jgi:hypothetical protein
MQEHAEFGSRCDALDVSKGLQEPELAWVPDAESGALTTVFPRYAPAGHCLRWWLIRATLTASVETATQDLARADGLIRRWAEGSHTLISHAIVWAWLERTALVGAQIVASRPAWRATVVPLTRPLPVNAPAHWARGEAAFQRASIDDLEARLTKKSPDACKIGLFQPDGLADGLLCRLRLGFLPNETRKAFDSFWLDISRTLPTASCAAAQQINQAEPSGGLPAGLAWRNTAGKILVDVARPNYGGYLARQSDAATLSTTLGAVLELGARPQAQRQGKLDELNLPSDLRVRLTLDGSSLVLKTCRSELEPLRIKPLRFPLPQ